jgi:hypothetical protein
MTSTHQRATRPQDGAAWTTAVLHVEDQYAVPSGQLHDHLLRDHGRTAEDLNGFPLARLHHFEHVEQAMGLNELSHQHRAGVVDHTRVPAAAEEAGPPES